MLHPLGALVLSTDDQCEPEPHHVDAGLADATEVEELRPAECPVIVMHRHFDDAKAGVRNLLHQLETDDAARFLERHPLEDRSPHQAEIAIDVAYPQSEQNA